MALPEQLDRAVSAWLAGQGPRSHRAASGALSRTYRAGGTSAAIDTASYLVARLPATFAAVARALAEVSRRWPGFAPRSLLDAGAGPGTASWAAAQRWDSLDSIRWRDTNTEFLAIAAALARGSGIAALEQATAEAGALQAVDAGPAADLVIASYALAELRLEKIAGVALALWRATQDLLVLIEPGTPDGFARILAARTALLAAGAQAVAPCPHAGACLLAPPDWCHFSVRLPRSRAHMHAKGASVPFEDEKFAYLAVSRHGGPLPGARILSPPAENKAEIALRLCTPAGLETRRIARRDRDAYKRARKLGWGDEV